MAFRDFAFPGVLRALGLTLAERELFGPVKPLELSREFQARIQRGAELASAVGTDKARSEFVIAPMLLELWERLGGGFGLFSGAEFDVAPARGLNGPSDFLLTRSPLQSFLKAPVVAIVGAKDDNPRNGLGECIATMVAARELNADEAPPVGPIFGAATTGTAWRFLRLDRGTLTLDVSERHFTPLERTMGLLAEVLREAGANVAPSGTGPS